MEGRTLRLIRLDAPRRPVTAADRDAFLEAMRARARQSGQLAMVERLYADIDAPDHCPAHFDIQVDSEGHIGVQDYQPFNTRAERTWHVFEREERYPGRVRFPAGFAVHQIAGGKVIGRWTDEDDVEHVRVYGIEAGRNR